MGMLRFLVVEKGHCRPARRMTPVPSGSSRGVATKTLDPVLAGFRAEGSCDPLRIRHEARSKEVDMSAVQYSRRSLLRVLGILSLPLASGTAKAVCAAPAELGRWRNLAAGADPAVVDLQMKGCGDQVLNGVQTETRYSMRVWVRQSTGAFYGRPPVQAAMRSWQGRQWFFGRVPTGGYVDNIWARVDQKEGKRLLHVLIKHESLDRKPSASSEHWFSFEKRI
jgi:hypothetical protein